MPRPATARDIDALPYHALQAEAAVSVPVSVARPPALTRPVRQKYSIRRNLGSAKLKIAIKRVQETGGDTKDLPREWLTTTAANNEPREPSSSAPAVMAPSSRPRRIAPRPKPSAALAVSQRQPREKAAIPSRIPSRTVKKDQVVADGGNLDRKNESDGNLKLSRNRTMSLEIPLTQQPGLVFLFFFSNFGIN